MSLTTDQIDQRKALWAEFDAVYGKDVRWSLEKTKDDRTKMKLRDGDLHITLTEDTLEQVLAKVIAMRTTP